MIARTLLIFVAVTFFAGAASACTCLTADITEGFNAPGTIVFRGTVLSSTLSSQCLAKMKTPPQDNQSSESDPALDRNCSISNTLEIQEYLKGHRPVTLVVRTQPMFAGMGSCATYLPPGSTFTIMERYDGLNEISVDQCSKIFDDKAMERTRAFLKDPRIDEESRQEWQKAVEEYDVIYALSKKYKAALEQADKNNSSYPSKTFARVRVMLDYKDWTSAMHELELVSTPLDSSGEERVYNRLMARMKALMISEK